MNHRFRPGARRQRAGGRIATEQPRGLTVPVELGESLRTIADPELKAVLEGLASGIGGASPAIPKIGKIS